MSRSPQADEATREGRAAGFTLIEVLTALTVAALLLEVLAPGLSMAWRTTRIPMETMSAMTVARAVAGRSGLDTGSDRETGAGDGRIEGFRYAATVEPFWPAPRRSPLAPPPGGLALAKRRPVANASELRRIAVVVTAPSGGRLRLDSVALVWPAN